MNQLFELNVELIFIQLSFQIRKQGSPIGIMSFHKFLNFHLHFFEWFSFCRMFCIFVDLIKEQVLMERVLKFFECEVLCFIEVEIPADFLQSGLYFWF